MAGVDGKKRGGEPEVEGAAEGVGGHAGPGAPRFRPRLTRRSFVAAGVAGVAAAAGVALGVSRCSRSEASVPAEPTGSGEGGSSVKVAGKLTMYTSVNEALVNAFVPAFEQQTGIVVDVVQKTAAECRDAVAEEVAAGRSGADVVWGGDESWYAAAGESFERYFSSENSNVREDCRNVDGYATPVTREVCAIAVNREATGELGLEVAGYADLLDERLLGRIAFADEAADAAAASALEAVRAVGGVVDAAETAGDAAGEAEAEDAVETAGGGDGLAEALLAQGDGVVRETSADVLEDVAAGAATVGLAYASAAEAVAALTGAIDVVYPEEGCLMVHGCTAIAKGARNLSQAQAWVDYACSEAGQRAAAGKVKLWSVRGGVGEDDWFPVLGEAASEGDLPASNVESSPQS